MGAARVLIWGSSVLIWDWLTAWVTQMNYNVTTARARRSHRTGQRALTWAGTKGTMGGLL
jgi:hypothetical protein